MSQLMLTSEFGINIKKGIEKLGLNFSESEFKQLETNRAISLEGKSLGEIGSFLILSEAILAKYQRKRITWQGLSEIVAGFSEGTGIPIFCWNLSTSEQYCLFFTLMDSKPILKILQHS